MKRSDIEKYGVTACCVGCTLILMGWLQAAHPTECRVEEALMCDGGVVLKRPEHARDCNGNHWKSLSVTGESRRTTCGDASTDGSFFFFFVPCFAGQIKSECGVRRICSGNDSETEVPLVASSGESFLFHHELKIVICSKSKFDLGHDVKLDHETSDAFTLRW